eukprot:gene10441-2572_t
MAQTVWNWGPLVALGLIFLIGSATIYAQLHENTSTTQDSMFVIWVANVVCVLYSFFKSIYIGPGFVPKDWPKNKGLVHKLVYCPACETYKAPRSHHCRQCGRCVKVLDHHCPWINSCVGNDNKLYFFVFVCTVPPGCIYSGARCILFLIKYYATMFSMTHARYHRYRLQPGIFVFQLTGAAAGIGVALAVSLLAYVQIRSILSNSTDIEKWIVERANSMNPSKPMLFPYNLGWRKNIKEIIKQSMRRDGINWRVMKGCSNYDLSIAVLAQRRTHAEYRHTLRITRRSGCWGSSLGIKTCISRPWTEGTLTVYPGDIVQVWRQKGRWLFGEKVLLEKDLIRTVFPLQRGWFPEDCSEKMETHLPYDYRGDGLFLEVNSIKVIKTEEAQTMVTEEVNSSKKDV